jgi:hypothetical protein
MTQARDTTSSKKPKSESSHNHRQNYRPSHRSGEEITNASVHNERDGRQPLRYPQRNRIVHLRQAVLPNRRTNSRERHDHARRPLLLFTRNCLRDAGGDHRTRYGAYREQRSVNRRWCRMYVDSHPLRPTCVTNFAFDQAMNVCKT